jgi:pimeloyl-ACP methyl ester carboxylesterase
MAVPALERAFRTLPERFLGVAPGFDATYHIKIGDAGQTWEVRATTHGARVRKGVSSRPADTVIGTDADTWLALRAGELSGLDAFRARRLYARGNLDLAVGFEGLFRLPNGRPPLLHMHEVPTRSARISTMTMGEGPDVLLLHGLGGAKSSFFDTAAAMSKAGYRVHALDLPGFGSSDKPATVPYNARYFATTVLEVMDQLGIARAHLVGNSMGGRVALEVGLRRSERVTSLTLLCPAVAFVRREFHPIVRLLRPEFGLLPHAFTRGMVEGQFWSMFRDPDSIDPEVADITVDEFRRIYRTPGARLAFLAAARNIYLDAPFGRGGFYPRLSELVPPAQFVWGTHDTLIPAAFGQHVARWLPTAGQITLDECGHVPQVEQADVVNDLLEVFFARAEALGAPGERVRAAA